MPVSELPAQIAGLAGLLAPANFQFTCPAGPLARWQVRRFTLHEALSTPYRLEVELATEDHGTELDTLLGAACTLHLDRGGPGRRIHGIIHQVDALASIAGRQCIRIIAAPALHLLAQQRNTRFWQNQTAPQILQAVLKAPLAALGREFDLQLDAGAYRSREYCVQYRETDLEFAERLMHEEGIVYAFDHDGEAERLLILGTTTNAQDLELPVLPFVTSGSGVRIQQSIDTLDWSHSLRTTSVVQRDWDWQDPTAVPYHRQRRGLDDRNRDRERYDHDDRRLHADDGDLRARHKLESEAGPQQLGRGSSDVVELLPGRCFELLRHSDLARDGRYLLLSIVHTGDAPEAWIHGNAQADRPRYRNDFVCSRPDVPYRSPQPPARPRVHGPHTAIVVGPEGEEIHTDEHGRIKVRFHWDRISPADDSASCWIRVTQSSAGPGWGSVLIPRIGMEVLVEFVDGDPDRPLVTGCVYNGHNTPPITLPDNKTQSGIKSDSSPGGGGYNELRFEDAKGNEGLFIHAQRDMTTKALRDGGCTIGRDNSASAGRDEKASVGNNRTASVGNNETVNVGADQSVSVGANQSISVTGNQSTNVTGDQSTNVTANQSINVTGNRTRDITGNDTVNIIGNEDLTVVGTSTSTRIGAVTEDNLATRTLAVVGAANETYAADLTVNVGTTQTHNVGTIAKLSAIAIEQLCAALFKVEAGVMIDMNTIVAQLSAVTITLNGSGSIILGCGGSAIQIDPGGITLNGGTIKIAGGSVDITGGIVKIN